MQITLGELAERLHAELRGDAAVVIRNAAGIREAREGDITFLANQKYESFLEETHASAVILGREAPPVRLPSLLSPDPYRSFVEVLELFGRKPSRPPLGVDPTAIVAPGARLGARTAVGPHVVIADGAVLGDDVVVMAGCYIGERVRIGDGTYLHPNVVLREDVEIGARCILHAGVVVGSDGFGYVPTPAGHVKVPQIGRVVVEDDVEIGANSAIDRATTDVTRVGRGTKIDNLVHVAHNVEIGPNSVLCAQVGISGSTRLGSWVTLAGQAGLVGHIEIGDGARVGAQGGVTKSIPSGETVSGYPAMNHARAQRVYASLRHLPDVLRQMRELERRLARLEEDAPAPANGAHGGGKQQPGPAAPNQGEDA